MAVLYFIIQKYGTSNLFAYGEFKYKKELYNFWDLGGDEIEKLGDMYKYNN